MFSKPTVKTFIKDSATTKLKTFNLTYTYALKLLPIIPAIALFTSALTFQSPMLLFCLVCSTLVVKTIHTIGKQVYLPKGKIVICQILGVSAILCLFWLDYFAIPAQAQFFGKAESFFQNTLTQGAESTGNTQIAVSLIFNVLRAIYLLYIAVSLVGVINAVRKDEDWQSIARVPLLVVVAVTVADVLTGFVIGNPNG